MLLGGGHCLEDGALGQESRDVGSGAPPTIWSLGDSSQVLPRLRASVSQPVK